jgi:phosphate transport system substrate-binding protein
MSTLKEIFEIDDFGCEIFALDSPEEVVDYISKNKSSIGVLGMSWINSLDRIKTQDFYEHIGLIAISNPAYELGGYFLPDQTSIGDKSYPLSRTIMGISREARVGLGTGFISFMASERGQRIILKSGLLPYNMPSRDLIIYDNEYKIE